MENEWKVIQNWVGHLFSATNDMHKKYFEDIFQKNKKRFQAQNVTEATLTKKTIVYRYKCVLSYMKYIYVS